MMSKINEGSGVSTGSVLPRARARFLAQAIQLEEEGVASIVKYSIYIILGFILAMIIWMSLTRISEVTVAGGKVIPLGHIHSIQHLEGGLIGNVFVEDGDRVEAGDLLVNFAPPASQSEFDQLQIRKTILTLDLERLAAIKAGSVPNFAKFHESYPHLSAKEEEAYRTQVASYRVAVEVVEARIQQRISELQRQKNQVVVLERETELLQKQVDIRSELAERHAISQSDLLRIQSEHASLQSDLKSTVDSVSVARRALAEERKHLDEVIAKQEQEMEREAATAENELAEVDSALIKAKDKVDRLMVYSPVKGIVQGLAVTTINAVVGPGEVIMQIVPVEDEMIIESRLMPDEVGYVRPGQLADIRVDSYDSSRFGTIKGSVRQISPSTYLDENANPYYKVKVGLEKSWLGESEGQMSVIPGMTVQVDIITGSKTIMQYLLKPVTRGFQSAFTQR
ncbi:MAG: HlyD family type I secretion periplasmic adaptor subunit [Halioglobus sp.]